jgi:Zn-finger nucleic acid-binding protein
VRSVRTLDDGRRVGFRYFAIVTIDVENASRAHFRRGADSRIVMTNAYRDALPLCPACSLAMEARTLKDATVDVCPACKGLWIDWFEGELAHVAHEVAPLSIPRAPVPTVQAATCPPCRRPLVPQAYLGVPFLWRCGECGGTFVPRVSFEALAELRPPKDPPKSALHRLVHVLTQLLEAPKA